MFSKSIIILIAMITISVIRADEEMSDMSAEQTPHIMKAEESNEQMKASESDSSTDSALPSEETTQTYLLMEEVDNTRSEPKEQSTTEAVPEELITSSYNGLDDKQSSLSFSCFGRSFGQYADVSKECRVFHLCYPFFNSSSDELLYQRITFLCDDDSVFDQKRFICVDNSTVEHKCTDSEGLYTTSNQEYLIRVFSQSVSPIDEVKGLSEEPKANASPPANPGWFNWLYNH
jgi:hypothetical protein